MNFILVWLIAFAVSSTLFAAAGVVVKIANGGFDRSLTDGGRDLSNLETPAFQLKSTLQAGVLSATILSIFLYFTI